MPPYNEPVSTLAGVSVDGTTPAKLFSSRARSNSGWTCSNNTGYGVYFLEVKSGEVPTAAQMLAAGFPIASGDGVEGDSVTGDVYALVSTAASVTLYPQEKSK